MTYKKDLTREYLVSILRLDEKEGRFYWISSGSGRNLTKPAGYKSSDGYRMICINGSLYKEHRLVWLYVTGKWPVDQLDHINEIKDDNRMPNLREATNSTNQLFREGGRSGAKTKSVGVSFHQNRYQASLTVDGVTHYLGRFLTEEQAAEAYKKAKQAQCDRKYEQNNEPVLIEL